MSLLIWVVDAYGTPGLSVQQAVGDFELKILRGSTKSEPILPAPLPHLAVVTISRDDPNRDLNYIRQIHLSGKRLPIIGIAVHSSEDLAIAALRAGCNDYLKLPYTPEDLGAAIERCLAGSPTITPAPGVTGAMSPVGLDRLVGESLAIRSLRAYVAKVAGATSTVLITGETGTGKEMVAQLLHENGAGRKKPFVTINCAAIPDTLLESELFGYEKGAFTGAGQSHGGKLQLAGDGTIFFDEVGDMSPYAQAKILRAIESREAYRLGGSTAYPIRCRIIAATNCDLERHVAEGKFRRDLYYRLNVARIRLPALRDRKNDIPVLCCHFIKEFNNQFNRQVSDCDNDVLQRLLQHEWLGNIRELRNLFEAAYLNYPNHSIALQDLPEWFTRAQPGENKSLESAGERERVIEVLTRTRWNKSKAAEALQWSRMTLYRKMAKYQILTGDRPDCNIPPQI